jgi:hypothetical protein
MGGQRPIAEVCNDLEALLSGPLREPDAALELAREAGDHPNGVQAVGLLLLLLERNQHLEWGTPGDVVHAVEQFLGRGYEPLLLESLRRAPTSHTLWMANRLVNGLPWNRREDFQTIMRDVAGRKDVPDEVRHLARQYVELQQSRG